MHVMDATAGFEDEARLAVFKNGDLFAFGIVDLQLRQLITFHNPVGDRHRPFARC